MNILDEIVLNTKTKLEEKKLYLPFNENDSGLRYSLKLPLFDDNE